MWQMALDDRYMRWFSDSPWKFVALIKTLGFLANVPIYFHHGFCYLGTNTSSCMCIEDLWYIFLWHDINTHWGVVDAVDAMIDPVPVFGRWSDHVSWSNLTLKVQTCQASAKWTLVRLSKITRKGAVETKESTNQVSDSPNQLVSIVFSFFGWNTAVPFLSYTSFFGWSLESSFSNSWRKIFTVCHL